MSGLVAEDVYVSLGGTISGTATQNTDYTIASGSIQISEGQLSGTRTFSSTEDNIYEGNETATLTIQGIGGGDASPAVENGNQQAVVTIVDDESAPTVTLSTSASSIAENSGSTITITATMSAADTADVTVAHWYKWYRYRRN